MIVLAAARASHIARLDRTVRASEINGGTGRLEKGSVTMWGPSGRFGAVKAAELALLDSNVRRDSEGVNALLHPDFAEIGRSGRRWTKSGIISALEAGEAPDAPDTDEWLFDEVALP